MLPHQIDRAAHFLEKQQQHHPRLLLLLQRRLVIILYGECGRHNDNNSLLLDTARPSGGGTVEGLAATLVSRGRRSARQDGAARTRLPTGTPAMLRLEADTGARPKA